MRMKVSQLRKIIAEEVRRVILAEAEGEGGRDDAPNPAVASLLNQIIKAVEAFANDNGLEYEEHISYDKDLKALMKDGSLVSLVGKPGADKMFARGEQAMMMARVVDRKKNLAVRIYARFKPEGGPLFLFVDAAGPKAMKGNTVTLDLEGSGDVAKAVKAFSEHFGVAA